MLISHSPPSLSQAQVHQAASHTHTSYHSQSHGASVRASWGWNARRHRMDLWLKSHWQMQAKNKGRGMHLLFLDDPIDSVWVTLQWCYKPSESSKREPDLRGDPRRHFAIDNWRWGDWEEIFAAHPRGFPSIAPRSPTVLESVFSKFTRTTGNALRFTKWKTKKRVLFHSLCALFSQSLPRLCLSVPNKIYWTGVKIPIRCWRWKQIHDEYLVSVCWTGKVEKPVKNRIWIFWSSLIVKLFFFKV